MDNVISKKRKRNKNSPKQDNNKKDIKKKNLKINCLGIITDESYSISYSDGIFLAFKSIYDVYYLIYSTKDLSIISYDLIDNCNKGIIKYAHEEQITNFRHYSDEANSRDLVISISSRDNHIKLWDINNLECLCVFEKIDNHGYINSACFINDKGSVNILTSHYKYNDLDIFIKVFNLKGNLVKKINDTDKKIVFIDTYYDTKLNKNFIVTGNYQCVISYDYDENKLYQKYCDIDYYIELFDDNKKNINKYHDSIVIHDKGEILKLIESSGEGIIRIWEFHTTNLLSKIEVNKIGIFGICLWDKDYLFAGSKKSIKLINLNEEKVVKNLRGHTNEIISIKKIEIPLYGECLISQDRDSGEIIMWNIKNSI